MKNILIVDDHPLFLHGMYLMIKASFADINVETVDNFSLCKRQLKRKLPDLLLFDLMLPDKEGIEGLQELTQCYPSLIIVVLSAHTDQTYIQTSIACGAKGYIPKTSTPDEFTRALKKIDQGERYMPKRLISSGNQKIINSVNNTIKISKRKREILMLVSQKLSNKAIANKLDISEGTVKQHLYATFKKLKVKTRKEAAQYASKHIQDRY
jgi:DNA-binding NarL/FixJ family response regulator